MVVVKKMNLILIKWLNSVYLKPTNLILNWSMKKSHIWMVYQLQRGIIRSAVSFWAATPVGADVLWYHTGQLWVSDL